MKLNISDRLIIYVYINKYMCKGSRNNIDTGRDNIIKTIFTLCLVFLKTVVLIYQEMAPNLADCVYVY